MLRQSVQQLSPQRMAAVACAESRLRDLATPVRLLLYEPSDRRTQFVANRLDSVPNVELVILMAEAGPLTNGAGEAGSLTRNDICAAWERFRGSKSVPATNCELAAAALALGMVDAVVGGISTTSADVLRAGFRFVGLRHDVQTVSIGGLVEPVAGVFPGRLFLMTDPGAVVEPTVQQFVDIATNAMRTWRIVGTEPPRIAFLSASTRGSASRLRNVDTIRAAVRALRSAHPNLAVDGEMQLDVAVVPDVALAKGEMGDVAGHANVLVFPSVDSCNIGYKIVEHLGGALTAPVTQGFARSYHDVSRGASPVDVASTCLFAAVLGAAERAERRQGREG